MACLCYCCGVIFQFLAAREIHILHLSSLPPYPNRELFTLDPYYITGLETPNLVNTSSPMDLKDISPLELSAEQQFLFTMDPSPDISPSEIAIYASELTQSPMELENTQPIFIMDPSPLATPSSATFPNPFIDTYTPSPRMFFPQPGQYLPTLPTITNWAQHLLVAGCTRLGKGCLKTCIPGAELKAGDEKSRFPLAARRLLPNGKVSRDSNRIEKRTVKVKGKKIKCWICQKYFLDLEKHIKVHEKEKKWKCGVCQESFSRKWILSRHAEVCR